jgi:hypothetical protein
MVEMMDVSKVASMVGLTVLTMAASMVVKMAELMVAL